MRTRSSESRQNCTPQVPVLRESPVKRNDFKIGGLCESCQVSTGPRRSWRTTYSVSATARRFRRPPALPQTQHGCRQATRRTRPTHPAWTLLRAGIFFDLSPAEGIPVVSAGRSNSSVRERTASTPLQMHDARATGRPVRARN